MRFLPLLITLGGTVGAFFLTPDFVHAHAEAFVIVNGVAQVLHAVLPSVFGAGIPSGTP